MRVKLKKKFFKKNSVNSTETSGIIKNENKFAEVFNFVQPNVAMGNNFNSCNSFGFDEFKKKKHPFILNNFINFINFVFNFKFPNVISFKKGNCIKK